jgi:hypothetical protein
MDYMSSCHPLAIPALKAHPGSAGEGARGIEFAAVTVDLDGLAELQGFARG